MSWIASLSGCAVGRRLAGPLGPYLALILSSPRELPLSYPHTFLENAAPLGFLFLTTFQTTPNPLQSGAPSRAWPKLSSVEHTRGLPQPIHG